MSCTFVLDSFLPSRAETSGAELICGLVTDVVVPTTTSGEYIVGYIEGGCWRSVAVDVVVRADGVNGRVAKAIKAGSYSCAIAFKGMRQGTSRSRGACAVRRIIRVTEGGMRMSNDQDLMREYLKKWEREYLNTFKFLELLQRIFYSSDATREAMLEICGNEYVQRMTYL
ncbi:Geranylgeranyl diphosphate reductase, chloroplastic-like protein [Drosera capensis]